MSSRECEVDGCDKPPKYVDPYTCDDHFQVERTRKFKDKIKTVGFGRVPGGARDE